MRRQPTIETLAMRWVVKVQKDEDFAPDWKNPQYKKRKPQRDLGGGE